MSFPGVRASGPVEAGRSEVRRALEARQQPMTAFGHVIEQSMVLKLESFQIQGALIRGGGPRALLYALMEAASSIESRGVVASSSGEAQLAIRGVRRKVSRDDLSQPAAAWQAWFRSLALARMNRARLIIEASPGESAAFLRMAAGYADEYAVDLAIEFTSATASELSDTLRLSPVLRSIVTTPDGAEAAAGAAGSAGRYVVVETASGVARPSGVPVRVLAPWKQGAARPCSSGCEFVWLFPPRASATVDAIVESGAAGFEVDFTQLEAWSGLGYAVKKAAAPSSASKAPAKKRPAGKKAVQKKATRKKP